MRPLENPSGLKGQDQDDIAQPVHANDIMERPAFYVSRDPTDSRGILFKLRQGDDPIPPNQARLMSEVEATLTILRMICPEDNKFELYFIPLLSLSKAGAGDDPARPDLALLSLQSLKMDVLAREGGRIKNQHMKALGKWVIIIGLPMLFVAIVFHIISLKSPGVSPIISQFLFLVAGCVAGVWLSFGARKTILRFEDLNIPEEDRLDPAIRIFFASLLTVILGLLFSTGAVTVMVGKITTDQINFSIRVALLLGLACGFSEQALSQKVSHHLSTFLDFKK